MPADTNPATEDPGPGPPETFRRLSFGVEMELVIQHGSHPLTKQVVAQVITDAAIPGVTVIATEDEGDDDGGWQVGDPPGQWRVTLDRSIDPVNPIYPGGPLPSKELTLFLNKGPWLPAEIISPVHFDTASGLEDETEDFARVTKRISAALSRAFDTVTATQSTGFHIHVGVGTEPHESFTLDEVKKISLFHLTFEDDMNALHAHHRSCWKNPQIRSNKDHLEDKPTSLIWEFERARTIDAVVDLMCPLGRGYKLNLRGLVGLRRTLEWRQCEGLVDPVKMCWWVKFVLAFVREALGRTMAGIEALYSAPPALASIAAFHDLLAERQSAVAHVM